MGRWLLLSACLFVVGALTYNDVTRAPDAKYLGGACESTHECRKGTTCVDVDGVMSGQCSAPCNASAVCQRGFGNDAICVGADLCARTCQSSAQCPQGTRCNAYGWCERPATASE
jgi:hypothetical protein